MKLFIQSLMLLCAIVGGTFVTLGIVEKEILVVNGGTTFLLLAGMFYFILLANKWKELYYYSTHVILLKHRQLRDVRLLETLSGGRARVYVFERMLETIVKLKDTDYGNRSSHESQFTTSRDKQSESANRKPH
jgi:hypothetical protein